MSFLSISVLLQSFVETPSSPLLIQRFSRGVWPAADVCVFNSTQMERSQLLAAAAVAARSSPRKILPHFFSAVFRSFSSFIFSTCVFFSGYATLSEYFPHSSLYWTPSVLWYSSRVELRSAKSPLTSFSLTVTLHFARSQRPVEKLIQMASIRAAKRQDDHFVQIY